MLSIGSMQSVAYYLSLARQDYYLQGGEAPGRWLGKGAELLQLSGVVQDDDLTALFHGFSPASRIKLVQNAGSNRRQPGWDLTFSAPKSVSVFWAVAPADIRAQILASHQRAVESAITYLEQEATFTRRERGGAARERCPVVIAAFDHATTRAQDPDLHTHCLALNVTVRADRSTGAVLSKPLYQHKMAAGALYRAELAHQLAQRLGLEIRTVRTWFELEGLSNEVLQHFSKRRSQILRAVGGLYSAKAAARAALETRDTKYHLPRKELHAKWTEEASGVGLESHVLAKLVNRKAQVLVSPQALVATALEKLTGLDSQGQEPRLSRRFTGSMSHVSERDLVRQVAELAPPFALSAADVRGLVKAVLPSLVRLTKDGADEQRFTTPQMLALEENMLADVKQLTEIRSHTVPQETTEKALHIIAERTKKAITEEQRAAVWHLVHGEGAIRLAVGLPGTGKTFLLDICREAWHNAGYKVIGATLAGKAARALEEGAGIKSSTIALTLQVLDSSATDVLKHHATQLGRAALGLPTFPLRDLKLDRHTVLVIDEAGMVPTWQMERLVHHAKTAGALLVLVGDPRQLPPIEAGGPFRSIAGQLGHATLTDIVRQPEPWAREAVKLLAEGNVQKAFSLYAEKGLVEVGKGFEVVKRLVRDWSVDGIKNPKSNLIFTGTNHEARVINTLCQKARLDASLWKSLVSVRVGEHEIYAHDRVLFNLNHHGLGVFNGDLGTVTSVDPFKKEVVVELDRRQKSKRVVVPLRRYKDLSLGYAVTTHKGQGMTVDKAFVFLGGTMEGKELSLVQASRARQFTAFYVDVHAAGANFEDLIRAMSTSKAKDLCFDLINSASARDSSASSQSKDEPPLQSPLSKLTGEDRPRLNDALQNSATCAGTDGRLAPLKNGSCEDRGNVHVHVEHALKERSDHVWAEPNRTVNPTRVPIPQLTDDDVRLLDERLQDRAAYPDRLAFTTDLSPPGRPLHTTSESQDREARVTRRTQPIESGTSPVNPDYPQNSEESPLAAERLPPFRKSFLQECKDVEAKLAQLEEQVMLLRSPASPDGQRLEHAIHGGQELLPYEQELRNDRAAASSNIQKLNAAGEQDEDRSRGISI